MRCLHINLDFIKKAFFGPCMEASQYVKTSSIVTNLWKQESHPHASIIIMVSFVSFRHSGVTPKKCRNLDNLLQRE